VPVRAPDHSKVPSQVPTSPRMRSNMRAPAESGAWVSAAAPEQMRHSIPANPAARSIWSPFREWRSNPQNEPVDHHHQLSAPSRCRPTANRRLVRNPRRASLTRLARAAGPSRLHSPAGPRRPLPGSPDLGSECLLVAYFVEKLLNGVCVFKVLVSRSGGGSAAT
jgi:hypothetical protein